MHFSTLFSAAALSQLTLAGYVLQDDYMSGDFYDNFEFFTGPDPTHGFVQYVDQSTAQSMNVINASAGAAVGWGVDTVNKDEAGRASVRLASKKVYNKGLVVIDVEHMPVGCGTWPAFWMVGPNWPNAGEIDILEGVHEQESNSITLHTGTGCAIGQDTNVFSGEVATQNCDIRAPGQAENQGCSISQKNPQSYGTGLNSNGGGVFATEWTSEAISVWFFARGDVAANVLSENPDPSSWGKPVAQFSNSGCEIESFFKDQQIVFDTTFCGDWAGNTWSDSCAAKTGVQTCNDYVRDNPEAFTNAFWTINALKVYSNDGSAAPQPSGSEHGNSPIQTGEPTDAPIATAEPTDAPVPTEQTTADVPAPTEQPTDIPVSTSSGFESPPIVPSTPLTTDAASAPIFTGDGTTVPAATDIPTVTQIQTRTRTRHRGGGHRTQEMRSASAKTSAPSIKAAEGAMGGFTWPASNPAADEPGTTAPSSTAVEAPVPTGTDTLPSTTAVEAPVPTSTQSLSSVDWNAVPSFSATIPPEVTSATAPTPTNTGAGAASTVVDLVPKGQAPSTTCTKSHPKGTAPVRNARHARDQRRRMVKHHAHK